jgi:hypothetical protein
VVKRVRPVEKPDRQPPEVVGGIFIVGIIAAVMEWLTIKSK